jgi:RNA polymerase sigma-70 factor (ECF subfamily)
MIEPIDKQIILLAQEGDAGAFESLLSHYEKAIYNYVFKTIPQKQEAEDITQEVFFKVYKNLQKIDINGNFTAWLYKVATNTTFDHLRRKKRKPELLIIDDEDAHFETVDDTPAYLGLEQLQDSEQLGKAMSNLRPEYKSILLLYYYQDYSYQEIAEIMDLPINTVKTYLHRARQNLKSEFKILYPN